MHLLIIIIIIIIINVYTYKIYYQLTYRYLPIIKTMLNKFLFCKIYTDYKYAIPFVNFRSNIEYNKISSLVGILGKSSVY